MKRALEEAEDGAEGKRERGEESEVEEFFAVLKRIEATKKQLAYICSSEKKKPFLLATAEAVTSKQPWRLSFEWEDFCSSGNGSRDVTHTSAAVSNKANCKQGNRLTNDDNKQRFACLHQNNNTRGEDATEMLDLNLPSNPSGLHLFF